MQRAESLSTDRFIVPSSVHFLIRISNKPNLRGPNKNGRLKKQLLANLLTSDPALVSIQSQLKWMVQKVVIHKCSLKYGSHISVKEYNNL